MNYVLSNYWVNGYAIGDASAALTGALQEVAPGALIELFQIELNEKQHGVSETYYFHAGVNELLSDVVWAGQAYQPFPIEAEGFEYAGEGTLPRPKIRVSNILGAITALLLTLPDGLEGAKVTRIRTLGRFLDEENFALPYVETGYADLNYVSENPTADPTAEFPREIFYVDRKTLETRDVIEFELASAFDLVGVRAPKRQCVTRCQWIYRSAECGYNRTVYYDVNDVPVSDPKQDVCGKRLTSCESRFNASVRTGSVVAGSDVLAISSTAGIEVGASGFPISGFGVPPGTVALSIIDSTSLTMSLPATATSSVTTLATPSAIAAEIITASAAGLGAGHLITGPYIPLGTTVRQVSDTTIYISSRPYSISRSGLFKRARSVYDPLVNQRVQIPAKIEIDTTGLSVGMKVFGPKNVDTEIIAVDASSVSLAAYGRLNDVPEAKMLFYFMPSAPAEASYSFTSSDSYSFKISDGVLPFGGFPGIGTYFV